MATKNPIQEEPIQDVSAPRAEPRAAHMIIARRDLLTGSMLVLVGSAIGGACNAQPRPSPVHTTFMDDFTTKFIGDPAKLDSWPDPSRKWPRQGQSKADVAKEYATFVNVLMTVGFVQPHPIPTPHTSLGVSILHYLQSYPWPSQSGASWPPYDVYLVEIAVILDRLLQSINSFGLPAPIPPPGPHPLGSPWPRPPQPNGSQWPPH
jgi:hypothetical protein